MRFSAHLPGLLVLFALPMAFFSHQAKAEEPKLAGRTVTEWLEWYAPWQGNLSSPSRAAIFEMGTNAIPTLLQLLQAGPARENETVQYTDPPAKFASLPMSERRHRIACAFRTLGTNAEPAVGPLTLLLNDAKTAEGAADCLLAIGPMYARQPLLEAMTHAQAGVRSAAAWRLPDAWSSGKPGQDVLAALTRCLADDQIEVRFAAANSLVMMKQLPDAAIPIFIEGLRSREPAWRSLSASHLGKFGPRAKKAIPALKAALDDPEERIRETVRSSLHAITR